MGLWGRSGGGLEPTSFSSCTMEEGRGTITGGHQTPLEVGVGREGGWAGEGMMKMPAAEDEDEEMRYNTVINHPLVQTHRHRLTPTQPGG